MYDKRVSTKLLLDRLVTNVYSTVSRYLLEADKRIYSLLLAIEVDDIVLRPAFVIRIVQTFSGEI